MSINNILFLQDGTVTAGNASGVNDGAAAVVLVCEEELTARNIHSIAKVVSYAAAGVEPGVMGTGPIPAVKSAVSIPLQNYCSMKLISKWTGRFRSWAC